MNGLADTGTHLEVTAKTVRDPDNIGEEAAEPEGSEEAAGAEE